MFDTANLSSLDAVTRGINIGEQIPEVHIPPFSGSTGIVCFCHCMADTKE